MPLRSKAAALVLQGILMMRQLACWLRGGVQYSCSSEVLTVGLCVLAGTECSRLQTLVWPATTMMSRAS